MATETILIVDSDVKISSGAERRKIAVSLSAHPLTTQICLQQLNLDLDELSERPEEFDEAKYLEMEVFVFREGTEPLLAKVQEQNLQETIIETII